VTVSDVFAVLGTLDRKSLLKQVLKAPLMDLSKFFYYFIVSNLIKFFMTSSTLNVILLVKLIIILYFL